MINSGKLAGKTVFITGASRGIGKAIGLKAARDGANVVVVAKTSEPHPKLKGTIHSAVEDIERLGGKGLAVKADIQVEEQVKAAIHQTIDKFGRLDILVNNASAISLTPTVETSMKRYDLMNGVNTRGTFMVSKYAIEFLKKSENGHILNISPPLDMDQKWFKPHVAYTIAKFGMSMCALGMSGELAAEGIAVNTLWPRTAIWTAAMDMLSSGSGADMCRKEDIMSDAAYAIVTRDSRKFTGNFCVDEDILREEGITDFEQYSVKPGNPLMADFFLPPKYTKGLLSMFGDKQQARAFSTSSRVFADASSGGPDLTTEKVFEKLSQKVNEDLKNEINAVMSFIISGNNWAVDAHSSRPFKISTGEIEKPDVTFIMDDETFLKLAKGEVKAANAFMSGKLKVKGNLAIAMKAEKIFAQIK